MSNVLTVPNERTTARSVSPLDRAAIAALLRLPPPPADPTDLHRGVIAEGTKINDAAVLVPLIARNGRISLLFTQRTPHLNAHAGQISFPGGRVEAEDAGRVDTALRETEEEIGLDRRHVQVIGRLPDHLIVTGFRVTPVVAFISPDFNLSLDADEVASTFEVPLRFILDPANHVPRVRQFEGHSIVLTDLPYGDYKIWGATATMLMTFYRVLRGQDE